MVWWDANVLVGKGARTELYRDPDKVPWRDAEQLTGMKQPRVSELSKRLAMGDKYRAGLLGVSYRAAMLEAAGNLRGTQGTGEMNGTRP
jgi:hypothetical protein